MLSPMIPSFVRLPKFLTIFLCVVHLSFKTSHSFIDIVSMLDVDVEPASVISLMEMVETVPIRLSFGVLLLLIRIN